MEIPGSGARELISVTGSADSERERSSRFPFLKRPSVARWAPIPLRLVVGCGFMEHGFAKLSRGPEAFAASRRPRLPARRRNRSRRARPVARAPRTGQRDRGGLDLARGGHEAMAGIEHGLCEIATEAARASGDQPDLEHAGSMPPRATGCRGACEPRQCGRISTEKAYMVLRICALRRRSVLLSVRRHELSRR